MHARWLPVLLPLLCLASVARAQPNEERYRQLIAEAVDEFDAERFPEARALFRSAHELSPSARTLRGLGMASFEMREYTDAYRSLSTALTDERRPLTEEQRAHAQRLLERCRRFLGFYRVAVTPASASLTVDGAPTSLESDGRLLLALGSHQVVAHADGYRDATSRVRVNGGEDAEITLNLESETPGQSRPQIGAAIEDGGTPALAGPDLTWPIALLAGGGALAAASIIVGLGSWFTREDEITRCDLAMERCTNGADLRIERDVAATFTVILAGLGAAGLVVGTVLFLGSAGSRTHSELACAPGVFGLACAGRF